jgi:hypothetical protein
MNSCLPLAIDPQQTFIGPPGCSDEKDLTLLTSLS